MRTYLKKFDTHEAYTEYMASSGFVSPNLSICNEEGHVEYDPSLVVHNFVDLGLPSGTLWATENIRDAKGNALYFAWGETHGYTADQVGTEKNFTFESENNDYAFGPVNWDDENYGMTKYNQTDGKTVLESTDDAATANWGSGWKTPTSEQFFELVQNTTSAYGGNNMIMLKSNSNGNRLFLPFYGHAEFGIINYEGEGPYWTSSLSSAESDCALTFIVGPWGWNSGSELTRALGLSIRPVKVTTPPIM